MNTRNFWNRVKSLIKEKGLTQQEVAKKCKIPHGTLKNWLHRDINPPLTDANKISRYLGVSLEYLIYGHGKDHVSKTKEKVISLLKEAEKNLTKIRRTDMQY
jgi:transcriptional regulator with XRE-family HTH domain